MVVPVGERYQQTLYLLKKENGELNREALRPTLFVPMTGTAEGTRVVQPDPLHPRIANGTFEDTVGEDGFIPGWYYQRQFRLVEAADAPEGSQYVSFENTDPGRGSRLLQGFSVDGRQVPRLKLSAWVKCNDVHPSPQEQLPSVVVSFYDDNRRDLSQYWLGPWQGTRDWSFEEKSIRVPRHAREAILRIGLFGATGQAAFDAVNVSAF